MSPLISVIIPLYNHERYIAQTIHSVLKQSFPDFELIIINDGSTDQSGEAVKAIKDERITYYFQENHGAPYTINKGIQLAKGKYVSILNSDDLYFENRLKKCITHAESKLKAAVFTGIELIDIDDQFIGYRLGQDWNLKIGEPTFENHHAIIFDLLAGNFLHTTSNLFCRKQVFDEIGYFANLRYVHDYDFFLRLCTRYQVGFIEEPLLRYRFHDSNTLGDDYASSNFETGLVLANFLLQSDLSPSFEVGNSIYEIMAKFHNSLNSYGTDRLILTLLVFANRYGLLSLSFFDELCRNTDNPLRRACLHDQRMNRDTFQLRHDLQWQASQTEYWWRKVRELTETIKWQKGETDRWWSNAEKCKCDLAWQREQTNHWWEEGQKLRQALADKLSELHDLQHDLNKIQNSVRWRLICKMTIFLDKLLPPNGRVRQWLRRAISHF